MRIALIVAVEVLVIVGMLVFAAVVAIPLAAPPPDRPTPVVPADAVQTCARVLPGCR